MLKQLITERFTFGIEDNCSMCRLILQQQAAQHIQDTVHGSCWFATAIGQRRKGVIGPIKIGRAINEDKRILRDLNHSVPFHAWF